VYRFAVVLLVASLSSGCLVVSLQPAYDQQSVAFDESLIGRWENADDETSAVIDRGEWRSYKIAYTDRFTTLTFHGNLTTIGAATFLDLTQVRGADAGPYLLPVHGIFRIAVAGDTLSVAALDYGWFTRATTAKQTVGLTTALDDRRNVVVTSSTQELRRWLARAPDSAFGAPARFARKRVP
jgi:hypothetical protein